MSAVATVAEAAQAASQLEFEEGDYNRRDVLSMCRIYKPLAEALGRTNTVNVYLVDQQMALLALQMSRAGMPIDAEERKRVGDHLKALRDAALVDLKKFVEPPYREAFVQHVAMLHAVKARKTDPTAGQQLSDGTILSHELAFQARVELRKATFVTAIEKHGIHKRGINFGAKVQQAALLRAAGVVLTKVTPKSGLPKVNKEILEEVGGSNPAARSMLAFLLTDAAIRVYIDGTGEPAPGASKKKGKGIVVDADNRLRPEWSIHKITGRWGSSPNVQNWSKRAGGGVENLRRMICAPEGWTLVAADFAQLEARIIAAASGDPWLTNVFVTKQDIHGALAGVAFPGSWPRCAETFAAHKPEHKKIEATGRGCGPSNQQPYCDYCELRNKLRDLTKRLEYGAFYGGMVETLYKSVVKDFPETKPDTIRQFMDEVNRRMPGVLAWRARVLEQAIKEGEIRSPILGRRECFPMGRVEPTVAYNYIPQSGGADLWALGAVDFCKRWDQEKDDARIIHNGHDSILILTRLETSDAVMKDVHECWERELNGVRFLMDVKRGQRWAE